MSSTPIFDAIGGETAVRALTERFYDLIETDPSASTLLKLHFRGHGVAHARREQFDFLCGFFGGPRHYAERHGHMNLRLIHAHVPIRVEEAEVWLACFDRAMIETGVPEDAAARLRPTLRRAAMMLVNDLAAWGMPATR